MSALRGEPCPRMGAVLQSLDMQSLNLAAFADGPFAARLDIARQFDGAFRTHGCALIRNYQAWLPDAAILTLRAEAAAFFALPTAAKERTFRDSEETCG